MGISVILAMAVAWTPRKECTWQFPKIVGCAVGSFESLSGGLIAAAGALFAGWLAWTAVRMQIDYARETADEQRKADEFAIRALLPHALSPINEYATGSIRAMHGLPADGNLGTANGIPIKMHIRFPTLPNEQMTLLRDAARSAIGEAADQIADLLVWLQIQDARQKALQAKIQKGSIWLPLEVGSAIIDAMETHTKADRLYAYARRTAERKMPRASSEELESTLRQMPNHPDWDVFVCELLVSRQKASKKKVVT